MVGRVWQYIQKWFYLEPLYLPLIVRALGLIGLLEGLKLWNCCFISAVPFVVPAWRVNEHLLNLPVLPMPCNVALFTMYTLVCLYFFAGGFKKIAVLYSIIFLVYYGSIELSAIGGHDRVLQICFLFALLFAKTEHASCSRRLVQIAVSVCYFCSALQKALFPDFINGNSLKAYFATTDGVTEYTAPWLPFLSSLHDSVWSALSVACVGFEFVLAIALIFRISRKLALLLAACFHLLLTAVTGEFVFMLVMWTGLVAFVEQPQMSMNKTQLGFVPPRNVETIAATFTMLFLIFFPLRIFVWKDHPVSTLGFLDRCPWTFCMYLMHQDPVKVYATYKTTDGVSHVEVLSNRSQRVNSDNQLIALAHFIQATHDDLKSLQIDSKVTVNHHWVYRKTLTASEIFTKPSRLQIAIETKTSDSVDESTPEQVRDIYKNH